MRSLYAVLTLATLAVTAGPAAAQHEAHAAGGEFPPGWQGRLDRPDQDIAGIRFMQMGDAFHIVTGPHVILWDATRVAHGEYRASATFVQERAPERLESFGILVGGRDLAGPAQDYLYFLVRHDGRYMIRHRAGDEVHTLAEWTEHDAVNRATADAAAENTLAIESHADRVVFRVNGTAVQSLDRVPMLNTDGIVGLRVGHHLDLHVRSLQVEPLPAQGN
jgi:hypothetical protein